MIKLVTGGSGFIGSRLSSLLNSKGYKVRLLSRKNVANFETIVCDLEKEEIPISALDSVDTIFHLAGYAHDLHDNHLNELRYKKINVHATIQLAKLAISAGVKQFIFISSIKAGGEALIGECMTEEDNGNPEGIYGKTKREAELKLIDLFVNTSVHLSIVRPSLVYGKNMKGNLKLMLSGIKKGWFPPLQENGNRQSMIHVDDLSRAILIVAKNSTKSGEIYIVTDGLSYSSKEIYTIFCFVLGKSVPIWFLPNSFFSILSLFSPKFRYKFNKLLSDKFYSSKKIESIGFQAKFSLKDINETSF